jgi:uncharacterized protein
VSARRLWAVTAVAPYLDGPAGVHGTLVQAATAFGELAANAGMEPVVVEDVGAVPAREFAEGGVLALFTIGETPWDSEQRRVLVETLRTGQLGVVAVHSATDACHGWPEYRELVGARFDGHPWTASVELEVDRDHPSTAHLPERFCWHDEIYLFDQLRPDVRVLLRVAEGQLDMSVPGARRPDCGYPLAWCYNEGSGRVFYTALGHFHHAWEQPTYLRHLQGGLAWVLGETVR